MNEKGKCLLAYLFGWIGGLIVLFGMNNNEKNTRFHAAQSIVLSGGYSILSLLFMKIPFITTILLIVYIVGLIFGIIKAYKEEDPALPIIGDITKSLFSKQIGE